MKEKKLSVVFFVFNENVVKKVFRLGGHVFISTKVN